MFDVFSAASILGRHTGLVQTLNGMLPEGEQAVSEVRAWMAKYQSTLDALAPLMPKITDALKEAQVIFNRHQASIKLIEKMTPEIRAMVEELLPLVQQARSFTMQEPGDNPNA